MIKVERIHVENYKNIVEADLELGAINVVVGENNAGKSNLLEVIPFLNHLINGPINDVKSGFEVIGGVFTQFQTIVSGRSYTDAINPLVIEVDFMDLNKEIFYSYKIILESIKKSDKKFPFPITITYESLLFKNKTHTGKAATIFQRDNNSVKYGDGIKKGLIISEIENHNSVMRILSIIRASESFSSAYKSSISAMDSVLNSHIFYFSPHLLKEWDNKYENKNRIAYFNLDSEISKMDDKPYWGDYCTILKNILGIEEIVFATNSNFSENNLPERTPLFKQNGRYEPMALFSDGTVVLLALITKLFSDTSDIFLIEEPENSIHPRALSELVKLIRRFALDKQFIITTHSPYLLNMIKPEEVFVAALDKGKSTISKLPNAKAIKKKLAKGFMDFGDIVFSESSIVKQGE